MQAAIKNTALHVAGDDYRAQRRHPEEECEADHKLVVDVDLVGAVDPVTHFALLLL